MRVAVRIVDSFMCGLSTPKKLCTGYPSPLQIAPPNPSRTILNHRTITNYGVLRARAAAPSGYVFLLSSSEAIPWI